MFSTLSLMLVVVVAPVANEAASAPVAFAPANGDVKVVVVLLKWLQKKTLFAHKRSFWRPNGLSSLPTKTMTKVGCGSLTREGGGGSVSFLSATKDPGLQTYNHEKGFAEAALISGAGVPVLVFTEAPSGRGAASFIAANTRSRSEDVESQKSYSSQKMLTGIL